MIAIFFWQLHIIYFFSYHRERKISLFRHNHPCQILPIFSYYFPLNNLCKTIAHKKSSRYDQIPGGVRHDPQRFMGKTVTEPHFNRDTVDFAFRKREINQTQGSKHCFHYGRERFGEFSRSHSGLRWLLLAIGWPNTRKRIQGFQNITIPINDWSNRFRQIQQTKTKASRFKCIDVFV